MALAPTLYDFDITLSHVDRGLDAQLHVRTARHPSESMERVWLRLLAFCCLHEERLVFGPGLSDPEAADLFADDLTGQKTLLVRVGRQDPAKIQRESDRAGKARVALFLDSAARLAAFREEAAAAGLPRLGKVELYAPDAALLRWLAAREERRQKLSLTVVGDHLYLGLGGETADGPLHRG
ncbi:MAG TPA: YaeQ family protein [Anaeromyxobacteraceae bacterium]|nr:YaeQ family protein [Anaeromyxobacteraceae bacterium]